MASRSLSLFLIAGEPSGDRLGAALMRGLAAEGVEARFRGVGGEAMAAEGLESLFPIEETSIMGIAEVLPRLPNLIRRINQTVEAVLAARPDALITVDSPGFTMRVAKKVRAAAPEIPIIHYVAPSVWAWRPGRAKKMAAHVDHVLALLPFEPPYMTEAGMTCDFVGHPVVERTAHVDPNDRSFRAEIGVGPDQTLVAVLPGSRNSEITRLAPVFGEALGLIAERHPDLAVVLPAAETVADRLQEMVAGWPVAPILLDPRDLPVGEAETRKFRALAACDAALAASGTISLELAAMETPTIIAYRASPLTVFILRRIMTVDTGTIANLVLGEKVAPEYLQERCTPELLAGAVEELLSDQAARARQIDGARRALALLGRDGVPPSRRAARSVLAAIDRAKGGCMSGIAIRDMTEADAAAVLRIYQQGIDTGNASYAENAGTWAEFDAGKLKTPRLVAERDGEVLGWATLSAVSSRPCYAGVAETAIYIANEARGMGVGDALLKALIEASEQAGIWTLQTLIFTDNRASIRLHEKHGFQPLGARKALGYMTFGPWKGWRDVAFLERRSAVAGIGEPE